jgi:hypothetical protein
VCLACGSGAANPGAPPAGQRDATVADAMPTVDAYSAVDSPPGPVASVDATVAAVPATVDASTGVADAPPETSTQPASGGPSNDAAGPLSDGGGTCPGTFVCDDFESYSPGTAPTAPWTVAKNAGAISVDTTRAYSGKQSVKITAPTATGYESVMMRIDGAGMVPVPGNVIYGRMMFWLDSSPTTTVHFTLVDGSGLVADAGYHAVYRYGGQVPVTGPDGGFLGSQWMASYDTTDSYVGVGPSSDCYLQSQGRVVPLAAWTCIEWEFDGPNDTLRFWIGGQPAPDLTVAHTGAGCVSQPSGYPWTSPTFSQLDIGWESYQADGPRTMWIDDAAFGTARIGCP